jgi:methyl-accepting chemotaxis protein
MNMRKNSSWQGLLLALGLLVVGIAIGVVWQSQHDAARFATQESRLSDSRALVNRLIPELSGKIGEFIIKASQSIDASRKATEASERAIEAAGKSMEMSQKAIESSERTAKMMHETVGRAQKAAVTADQVVKQAAVVTNQVDKAVDQITDAIPAVKAQAPVKEKPKHYKSPGEDPNFWGN